jgi:DNA gyrase/topoisomerase IV subunit B
LLQALCPAVDAALAGACRYIEVSVKGATAMVSFDAGLPLSAGPDGKVFAKVLLTVSCACRNLKKHFEVGDELCDLGLTRLTALTEQLRVETRWQGKAATYVFARGQEIGSPAIVDTAEGDRTVMTFGLDPSILGENVAFDARRLGESLAKVRARVPGTEVVLLG